MDKKLRAHAIINGRVQGVFFRVETQHAAERIGVSGWVRNRSDGTVEAVFEGDGERVNAVLKWCEKGPPHAVVTDVVVKWQDFADEFKRFEVLY